MNLLPVFIYRLVAREAAISDPATFEELSFIFHEAGDVPLRETLDAMVAEGLLALRKGDYFPAA